MPTKLSPADFLEQSGVHTLINELQQHFTNSGKPLTVSDVTDEKGHQYVDLVQEGGGVLGIALVGYTYVLEKMGIRFFSLAGTSAGSINAMLLGCAGNKEDEKSSSIVEHLVKLDMFSFVDGKSSNWKFTKWIKKIIQQLLLGSKALRNMMRILKWTVLSLLILIVGCIVFNFIWPGVAKWIGLGAGILLVSLFVAGIWIFAKFKQFAKRGYGLNEGKVFHDWIKSVISSFHVQADPKQTTINNYADFSMHYMRVPPGLTVKSDQRRSNNIAPAMPMLTLITCDIIAERKIEFTQMWDLYWTKPEDLHPGDFVRASMSIPIFFETYSLAEIRKKSSFGVWDQHLNWQNQKKAIPDTAQFIDGGTLSNFPINVFYNANYPVPRMPTFGIRLQDGILDGANRDNNTLFNYIASLFATIRFNFDRDFTTKNRAYNMGVKNIDVREHSWLNFFMDDKEKIALFQKGARAAVDFLKSFDWEVYKAERLKNFELSKEKFENPNNMEVGPYAEVK
jgi:NTE family protein